jgi:hypothetical protein
MTHIRTRKAGRIELALLSSHQATNAAYNTSHAKA